jgi:hypothetical protein
MITLISHFYNEEFLLPYWLRHHRNLFDHGIMINYQSTDASCDIIKELVPEWELINTRNTEGWVYPDNIDREVMEIEEKLPLNTWKMALNTTEFIFHNNLRNYLTDFDNKHPGINGVRTNGLCPISKPEDKDKPADPSRHLILQETYDWVEGDGGTHIGRRRLLHRHSHGNYVTGRHETYHNDCVFDPKLYLIWFYRNWRAENLYGDSRNALYSGHCPCGRG